MQYLTLVVLLSLSLHSRMESAQGPGVCHSLVPASLDPPPTLQHLPCPDTRYRGTWENVPRLRPRATSTLAHMYPCTSSLLQAPCSTSASSRSKREAPPHTPAGTSHPARQPRPRSPCPSSLSQLRLGQCFSFLPQSFHSILMWSYVLYHLPINPSLIRAASCAVPWASRCSCCWRTTLLRRRVCFPPWVVTLSYYTQTFPLSTPTTTPPLPSSFHHARETLAVGLCTTRAPTETHSTGSRRPSCTD